MLRVISDYLFEKSPIYRSYHRSYHTRGCSPGDLEFRWRPFHNVTSAFREWRLLMRTGDEWWFWITLNNYREHDEMGYFSDYPNEQNY